MIALFFLLDDEIDERREPNTWREVEDTINDEEDPMEDVFLSTLAGEAGNQRYAQYICYEYYN